MRQLGRSIQLCAETLDRSERACRNMLAKMRVPSSRLWSAAEIAYLYELKIAGFERAYIADKIGRSRRAVGVKWERLNAETTL